MTYSQSKKQRGLPHSDLKSVKPFCLEEMRCDTIRYVLVWTRWPHATVHCTAERCLIEMYHCACFVGEVAVERHELDRGSMQDPTSSREEVDENVIDKDRACRHEGDGRATRS